MSIKDEIKKLEEVARKPLRVDSTAHNRIDCAKTYTAQDALKIINKLMEVVEMQHKTLKSAEELKDWIAEKSSRACYEIEELEQPPERSKALQEIFDSMNNGLIASYRDEFWETEEKSKQLLGE